jgi:hypothetical protein
MHSSVPERIRPVAGAMASACLIALIATLAPMLPPSAVRAANNLHDGTVAPGSGTTATTFLFSVIHSSAPQVITPDSVTVSVAGLSLPMLLVGGEPKTGLTYQTSTELPAGTWTATFTAEVPEGENPAPYELAQPIVVTTPPTPPPPTPGPTPPRTPPPTPSATSRPTPMPTPLPPGVTPGPLPQPTPPPPGSAPGQTTTPSPVPTAPAASGAPAASASPLASAPAEAAEEPSIGASSSPTASAREAELSGSGGGIGQVGWVVLGGATAVAGASVIVRQWLLRRRLAG